MTEYKALLQDCCEKMGVSLQETQLEQFMTYLSLLLEWNEKMNLTAITEKRDASKFTEINLKCNVRPQVSGRKIKNNL